MQLKIEYNPTDGFVCPDDQIEAYVDNIATKFDYHVAQEKTIDIGSELIIMAIRVAIIERLLPYDLITFIYEGKEFQFDANARTNDWPSGFCEHIDEYLEILISKAPELH